MDTQYEEIKPITYHNYPEFMYAGFWMRFFAYLLDVLIISGLQGAFLFFLKAGTLKTYLSLAIFLAYFILMTKLNKGQTLGKMVFGLRVICFREENLSWSTVIVRELFGRYLQKVFLILYILVAFTPKKQHVVDLLTETSVLTENYLRLYHPEPVDFLPPRDFA